MILVIMEIGELRMIGVYGNLYHWFRGAKRFGDC